MRREFSRSIKVAVIKRATRDGVVYCETCKLPTKGGWQIDHVRADGLLGEPVLSNASLICEPCWRTKNPSDTTKIARAKRREAVHLGVRSDTPKIPADPNALRSKRRPSHEGRSGLPPRSMYEEVR